jgi:hypothetical protein
VRWRQPPRAIASGEVEHADAAHLHLGRLRDVGDRLA